MSAVQTSGRFALVVVVRADNADDAFEHVSERLDDAQYGSNAWEVAECDGAYDFDSVLAQKFDGPKS